MKISHDQRGIAHVLVVVLLMAVVAGVAFAGYRVVKNNESETASLSSGQSLTAVPKKFQSTSDLVKASKALDATPIESGVNPSQLDSDLNAIQ